MPGAAATGMVLYEDICIEYATQLAATSATPDLCNV